MMLGKKGLSSERTKETVRMTAARAARSNRATIAGCGGRPHLMCAAERRARRIPPEAAQEDQRRTDEQGRERFKEEARRAGESGKQEADPGCQQRRKQNPEDEHGLRIEEIAEAEDRPHKRAKTIIHTWGGRGVPGIGSAQRGLPHHADHQLAAPAAPCARRDGWFGSGGRFVKGHL